MAEAGQKSAAGKPHLDEAPPIPLFGFRRGDTMGLVIVAHRHETVHDLARKLQRAASVRVRAQNGIAVWYRGKRLDLNATIGELDLAPLERFDVTGEDDDGV